MATAAAFKSRDAECDEQHLICELRRLGRQHGGGLFNSSTDFSSAVATVNYSTLSGNSAPSGGAIFNDNLSSLAVNYSTLSADHASTEGGGILNRMYTSAAVYNSTFSGNSALQGAGVLNYANGALTLVNSTLSGNLANMDGGGIYNVGTANVYNTTIVFNVADADSNGLGVGGGILTSNSVAGATTNIRNTLVAGNRRADPNAIINDDCRGTVHTYGRNLFYGFVPLACSIVNGTGGSWSTLSSLSSIDPLRNYGGPTLTHLPRVGSQMIDDGDATTGCIGPDSALLLIDQRGRPRLVDGDGNGSPICDIGAVERQPNDSDIIPWLYLPLIVR